MKAFLQKHLNYFTFLVVLLLLILLKIINPSFIKSVSYLSFDLYQKVFSEKKDSEVIIIDIDEESLGKFGQFPWNRNVFAKMLFRFAFFSYFYKNMLPAQAGNTCFETQF